MNQRQEVFKGRLRIMPSIGNQFSWQWSSKINSFFSSALAVVLSSCAYTTTSNTFSYHGTDLENTAEPFSYVQKNLVGSAETSYTWRGGGNTRNGLLADAFEDLNDQFKLDVNQTLANVAIDFMEIESGLRTPLLLAFFGGVSYVPSDYTTIVNIRADIIEFGLDSPWTVSDAGFPKKLDQLTSKANSIDAQGETDNFEGNKNDKKSRKRSLKPGDKVQVEIEGNVVQGEIKDVQTANSTARVRYKINNRSQEGFFFLKDIRQIQ